MKISNLLLFTFFLLLLTNCETKIKQKYDFDMGTDDIADEKLKLKYVEDYLETYDKQVIKFKIKMPEGTIKESKNEYVKQLSKSSLGASIGIYFSGSATETLEELAKEAVKWETDVIKEKKEVNGGLLVVVKSEEYESYSIYYINKERTMQVLVGTSENRLELGKEIALSLKIIQ